jgi:hypothetical protein
VDQWFDAAYRQVMDRNYHQVTVQIVGALAAAALVSLSAAFESPFFFYGAVAVLAFVMAYNVYHDSQRP